MIRPVFVLLAASLFPASLASAQTEPAFIPHSLGHGAWTAIDNPSAKTASAGSNAGFLVGQDTVLVVDTFDNEEAAKQLLALVRKKSKFTPRFVVDTHYHLDHVGGNGVFASAGAAVLAQDNVYLWERTENLKFFGPKITPEQRDKVGTLVLPDLTYAQSATVHLGSGHDVLLRYMPGHTGGDTIVFDPAANVVFCGDLFWNRTLPNLIDASTQPWIETLDTLVRDYPAATFVPGHGDNVGKAEDLRAFRDYLIFLRDAVKSAQARGEKEDTLLKSVLPLVKQKYGSWQLQEFAETDIKYTDEELRGVKRFPPQPTPAFH